MPHPRPQSVLLMSDWFDHRFLHGVARFAREHRWHLSLDSAYTGALPMGWHGDGVVAMITNEATIKFIRSLKIPVVGATHRYPELRLPRVHNDGVAVGRMAAAYFLERGFRQLAFCSFAHHAVSNDRRDGFAAAAKAAGVLFVDLFPHEDIPLDLAWDALQKLLVKKLRALGQPTGICCLDDRLASLLVATAIKEEMDIPGQLSIMGIGDLEIACECSWLPLSSVQLDQERVGYEAAKLLDEVMAGEYGPWPIKMPPTRLIAPVAVVERASTQGVAVQDPHLARVIKHMYANLTDNNPMELLADIAHVGRRQLYELFADEFKTTPALFLEHVRLRKVCALLANTDKKMQAVAKETGFGTTLRMHRAFMRCIKMTPGAWRKLHAQGKAPQIGALPQGQQIVLE